MQKHLTRESSNLRREKPFLKGWAMSLGVLNALPNKRLQLTRGHDVSYLR
jgi:hypothetical protein